MLQAEIFNHVGNPNFSIIDTHFNRKITVNFLGLAFLAGLDQFVNMSFAQVIQIPVARPIFSREITNRMYSTSAYYLATVAASLFTFLLYPIVTSLVSFFFFDLEQHSFTDLMIWTTILILMAFAGSFWGFMIGAFTKNLVLAV